MAVTSSTQFANLRDVATGLPGGTLKPGALLRGDAPDPRDAVPEHVAWPPAVVLDLRSAGEAGTDHPLAADARIHHVPVLAAADPALLFDLVHTEGLTPTYLGMLVDDGATALVRGVEIIAAAEGPVLVHCAVGKDRTGVLIALTLRLIGVDREAVLAEYLQTNASVEALLERPSVRDGKWADRLRTPDGAINPLMRAEAAALNAVMDAWDAEPGGTTGWFLARGGSSADVDALGRLRA